jgi:hypothetical protein
VQASDVLFGWKIKREAKDRMGRVGLALSSFTLLVFLVALRVRVGGHSGSYPSRFVYFPWLGAESPGELTSGVLWGCCHGLQS